MWSSIGVSSTSKGEKIFPNLISVLDRFRSLPHSNAEAERGFSMLTDAKTPKRNRLEKQNGQLNLCYSISLKGES